MVDRFAPVKAAPVIKCYYYYLYQYIIIIIIITWAGPGHPYLLTLWLILTSLLAFING